MTRHFIKFFVPFFALFFEIGAFADVNCYITTPSDEVNKPGVYDKNLISFKMPDDPANKSIGYEGNRRAVVEKDMSAARELIRDEVERRESESDFKDLDGKMIVSFQHPDNHVMGITFTVVDASKKPEEMDRYSTFGEINDGFFNLNNFTRKIWALCLREKASAK